jgi:hypothetical protein
MANKLVNKKPDGKKSVAMTTDSADDDNIIGHGSIDRSKRSSRKDVVNAKTAKVLRDADAGKNLLNYDSLEDMFKDLGM